MTIQERAHKWIVAKYLLPDAIAQADSLIQELLVEVDTWRNLAGTVEDERLIHFLDGRKNGITECIQVCKDRELMFDAMGKGEAMLCSKNTAEVLSKLVAE